MSHSLGVLPDRYLGPLDVPGILLYSRLLCSRCWYLGTVLLFQDTPQQTPGESTPESSEHEHTPELIKTKEGIVLSPQPHEDPNDPLVLFLPSCPSYACQDNILIVELACMATRCHVGGIGSSLSRRRRSNTDPGSWLSYHCESV